ncbi:MAG TPA: hypothetical protein VJ749_10525 [Pyrinomonadaceae bacterium]|nr:hypothetical protein [Pyrinomonadaceae bacterium]
MKTHTQPTIAAIGLDDLGIHLQAPYGAKSIHHALIINDGPHSLMAFEVVFEFVSKTGSTDPHPRIVGYAQLLRAKPTEREALFKKGVGVTPHTKLLVNVGMQGPDMVEVTDTLPPLTDSAVGLDNPEVTERYEKINIRLNAVVLENGEILGPGAKEFNNYVQKVLREAQQ